MSPISIAGSGTITGISAGGLPDACITTADLADGAATPAKTTGGPAFSAYASTATSTPNNSFTKVVCDTEEFDTANCYSIGSSRFTPNVAGYYQFNGQTGGAGGLSTILVSLYKNGAEIKRGIQTIGATISFVNVSALVYLNGTTDYAELYWYQGSGSTANNTVQPPVLTYFQGFLARPA
jgi:hypothetical protein